MNTLKIKEITINDRMRKPSDKKVDDIAASIKEVGLINPITVTESGVLIAGYHRLLALKKLGKTIVQVNKMDLSDLDQELAEIDENLTRNELTVLQQSEHLKRRQDILRLKGERAPAHRPEKGVTVTPLKTNKDLAEEMGMSKSSIQKRNKIANGIADDVKESISDTPIANSTTQLTELAKMEPEEQREAVEMVAQGKAKNIQQAKQSKTHVTNNSGNEEWYTPKEYIEAARKVMGSIDTDPASCELANKTVKASSFYTKEDSGLDQPWGKNVWLNPPYANDIITQFCVVLKHKLAEGEVKQAITLTNNATETKWFQHLAEDVSAICFPRSRIKFLNYEGKPKKTPLQGQVLLYFGDNPEAFKRVFDSLGLTVIAKNIKE